MALTIEKASERLIQKLIQLKFKIDYQQKTELQKTGFINLNNNSCRIANILSKTRVNIHVNINWFKFPDNFDRHYIIKPQYAEYEYTIIPLESTIYIINYITLRKYALQLEIDRNNWFYKPNWGMHIKPDRNIFKWSGGNSKSFGLAIFDESNVLN